MRSLVAVGACYLDTILTVPHYPAEDEKLRASSISRRRGGNTLNTLEVLTQLFECRESSSELKATTTGPRERESVARLCAAGVLPAHSSPAIKEIAASLGPNVDLKHCIYREGCTEPASSYIIKSQGSGTRTIVSYNELPEMTAEEFIGMLRGLSGGGGPMWFHFEGRIPDVTLQCVRHLRKKFPEHKISVEVEKPVREGLQELAAEADVVFYSKTWAQNKGYESPEGFLHAQSSLSPKASILFCTWGEQGAAALDKDIMKYMHTSAYTDAQHPVIDTIGAGDTFNAGILYYLLCHEGNLDLQKALEFANQLAGRKVIQEGFDGLGKAVAEFL